MKVWNDIAVGNIYRKVGPHGPMDIIDRLIVLEIKPNGEDLSTVNEMQVAVDVTVMFEGGEKEMLTLVYNKYEHVETMFADKQYVEDFSFLEPCSAWSETYELDELD